MKYLSLFSGIGAFEKALDKLQVNYELVNFCEFDKYAVKSYCAIHGVDESKNLGDITKVNEKTLQKNIDLITYGFPCQDISLAGKQKGLFNEDGTQTRSGLFFEALRIIEETQPRVAIAENVKNLTSKKFSEQFKIVLDSLEAAGYNNYYQVLNSKDFGVPQNRERVFIVSVRKDIDTGCFKFPQGFPLELRLKDMLETEVDEKYYISDDKIQPLIKNLSVDGVEPFNPMPDGTCRTLKNQYYKNSQANFIKQTDQGATAVISVGNVNPSGKGMNGTVIDSEGLARTITQEKGEGQKILVREATKLGYAEAHEGDSINLEQPNSLTRRGRVGHQVAQTITTSPQQAVVINPLKKKTEYGWHFEQNVYDANGITRALKAGGGSGNIPKVIEEDAMTNERAANIMRNEQCCQEDPVFVEAYEKAIEALDKQAVVEPNVLVPKRTEYGKAIRKAYESGEIQESRHNMTELVPRTDGISNTLTTVQKDNYLMESSLRIRKLTPKECFRLQDFDDEDFAKAEAVNSNTQLYKQAGNSITVAVPYYIFKALQDANILGKSEVKEMELKVNEVVIPEQITFNYEELKQELTEKVSHYEALVYTDEQIKEAKTDRASLNKLKKALNDERIRREREYMQPFNEFKTQINEIISIIDKPVAVIDKQVKAFEDKQRQDKLDAITVYFNNSVNPYQYDWLHISQIMDDKWLNASTSMKSVQNDIDTGLERIKNDLATLANLPEFGFEAVEVYKSTLDINKAVSEAQKMSQIAKAKAEREAEQARLKAEAEAKKQAEEFAKAINPPVSEEAVEKTFVEDVEKVKDSLPEAPAKQWIAFQALLTTEDALALKQFFNDRNIEFKHV